MGQDEYSRLTDSCITQLKAQGPSRTCNESKEEESLGTVKGLMAEALREKNGLVERLNAIQVLQEGDSYTGALGRGSETAAWKHCDVLTENLAGQQVRIEEEDDLVAKVLLKVEWMEEKERSLDLLNQVLSPTPRRFHPV